MLSAAPAFPAIEANGALGAELVGLFASAATGSLVAQQRLRDSCADAVVRRQGNLLNHDILAAYAVFAARLCASHGDPADAERLAAILLNVGIRFGEWQRNDLADSFAAEALSLYERMALNGDNDASRTVEQIVMLIPDLADLAKPLVAKGAE